jgi:hypothetical protein
MRNLLPWQAQLTVPPDTEATVQPACVHTADKPTKAPAVGWVITTFSVWKIFPPPTGMSAVRANAPALDALPPAAGAFDFALCAP